MKFTKTEAEAWAIINQTPARLALSVTDTYQQQLYRRKFVQRIERRPDGCWIWTGRFIPNSKNRTPTFDYRDTKVVTVSAYGWMLKTWFPRLFVYKNPTRTRCGNDACISPIHRITLGRGNQKVPVADIKEIYALKGKARAQDVGKAYGLASSSVFDIWSGRRRSNVTGAPKKCR